MRSILSSGLPFSLLAHAGVALAYSPRDRFLLYRLTPRTTSFLSIGLSIFLPIYAKFDISAVMLRTSRPWYLMRENIGNATLAIYGARKMRAISARLSKSFIYMQFSEGDYITIYRKRFIASPEPARSSGAAMMMSTGARYKSRCSRAMSTFYFCLPWGALLVVTDDINAQRILLFRQGWPFFWIIMSMIMPAAMSRLRCHRLSPDASLEFPAPATPL